MIKDARFSPSGIYWIVNVVFMRWGLEWSTMHFWAGLLKRVQGWGKCYSQTTFEVFLIKDLFGSSIHRKIKHFCSVIIHIFVPRWISPFRPGLHNIFVFVVNMPLVLNFITFTNKTWLSFSLFSDVQLQACNFWRRGWVRHPHWWSHLSWQCGGGCGSAFVHLP